MKICLLIAGRLDTFEEMYEYLQKYILMPLKPDVYFSGHPHEKGTPYCETKVNDLWKPKKYMIRDYTDSVRKETHPDDSKFRNKRSETTPHTWLSGIYNVYLANKLKKEYEIENGFRYDVCIKARTDLMWTSTPTEEELKEATEPNKVLIPTAWDFTCVSKHGVSDVTCISNSESMDKYSSLIKYIDEYYDSGHIFHPESLMGHHILNMKLDRVRIEKGENPFTSEKNQSGWAVVDPNPRRRRMKE